MADTAQRRWTLEDYLAWEATQVARHEFVDGFVRAMAGGTTAHNLIAGNVFLELRVRLRGKGCMPYAQNTRVMIPAGNVRYPDVVVDCAPVRANDTAAIAPTVIVEVLSRSATAVDLTDKLDEYQSIESIRHILHLYQDKVRGALWTKGSDGWRRTPLEGVDAVVQLDAIDVGFPLALAYIDVPFGEEAGEA